VWKVWRYAECILWFFLGVFTDPPRGWKKRRILVHRFGRRLETLEAEDLLTQFHFIGTMRALLWHATCPLRWLVGWDLEFVDACAVPGPKTVYGETISLFGLILTSALGLTLSQKDATERQRAWYLWTFVAVAVMILAGIVIILRARWKTPNKLGFTVPASTTELPKHAYERGSIMFARNIFVGVAVVASLFTWMAYDGLLPGQEFVRRVDGVRREKSEDYTFKYDGANGIVVPFSFGKKTTKSAVPSQLSMEIHLMGEIANKWKVQEVFGFVVVTDEKKQEKLEDMEFQPIATKQDAKALLSKLRYSLEGLQAEKEYRVKIYLHPRQKDEIKLDTTAAKADIDGGKGIEVRLYSK
jgi:hypothetical protein